MKMTQNDSKQLRNRFVKSRNDSRALKNDLGNNIRIICKTLTKFYESLSIKFAVELICFFRHVDRQQFLFSFMHEIVVKKGIISSSYLEILLYVLSIWPRILVPILLTFCWQYSTICPEIKDKENAK